MNANASYVYHNLSGPLLNSSLKQGQFAAIDHSRPQMDCFYRQVKNRLSLDRSMSQHAHTDTKILCTHISALASKSKLQEHVCNNILMLAELCVSEFKHTQEINNTCAIKHACIYTRTHLDVNTLADTHTRIRIHAFKHIQART